MRFIWIRCATVRLADFVQYTVNDQVSGESEDNTVSFMLTNMIRGRGTL